MEKAFKPSQNLPLSVFFAFLKQNDAYDSFKRNFSDPDLAHGIDDLTCARPSRYISCAFFWSSTPEGNMYWRLLDFKWYLVRDLFNF